MNSDSRFKVAFLCSPNIGTLENWLPVFAELKRINSQVRIICLIPKPSISTLIDSDSDLVKISENYIDEVVFKSYSEKWIKFKSLSAAKKANTLPKLLHIMLKIENYFKKFSFKNLLNLASKIIHIFLNFHDYKLKKYSIDIDSFLVESKFLLLDMVDLDKGINTYNKFLIPAYPSMVCFSMHHGVNIGLDKGASAGKHNIKSQIENNPNTHYYLFSKEDVSFYQDYYGIKVNQKEIGVPRHNHKWMRQVIDRQDQLSNKYHSKPFLLVISRPASDFLPLGRKEKTLRDIKRLAIEKLDLNVVIKYHPKEKNFDIYEKVFGKEQYNQTWFYSKRHPYILAEKCKLCVTFYSSLVVDFIFLGTPVIEYLNLKGIEFHDNEDSYRDEFKNPVFDYRYFGLALGADNFEDLENQAHKILSDKDSVLNQLTENYKDIFYFSDNSANEIAVDILEEINNASSNN